MPVRNFNNRSNCHAAILAGGESRRMGTPKALLEFEGEPLIAGIARKLKCVFSYVTVVTSFRVAADAAECPAITDRYPDMGPLAGVHAALEWAEAPVFCVACDMPFLNLKFLRYMVGFHDGLDAVVPVSSQGMQPLHTIYRPGAMSTIEKSLKLGRSADLSLQGLLLELKICTIEEEEMARIGCGVRMFENWNTPADIRRSANSRSLTS